MKKWFMPAFVLSLTVLLLAGCGKGAPVQSSAVSESGAESSKSGTEEKLPAEDTGSADPSDPASDSISSPVYHPVSDPDLPPENRSDSPDEQGMSASRSPENSEPSSASSQASSQTPDGQEAISVPEQNQDPGQEQIPASSADSNPNQNPNPDSAQDADPDSDRNPDPEQPDPALYDLELSAEQKQIISEIIEITNEYRRAEELPELEEIHEVTLLATLRAGEGAVQWEPVHYRPDGSFFNTIFTEYNVPYTSCGENLLRGNGYVTPREAVDAWMGSDSHRENILNPEFTGIGVGYYQDGSYWYWTQLLVR